MIIQYFEEGPGKAIGWGLGVSLVWPATPYQAGGPHVAYPEHVCGGCSGANLTKTESAIDAMADGPERVMGQNEIALAQTAMLDGKMGARAMHLSKAMHVGAMNQAST
jgi:hypothetical protein